MQIAAVQFDIAWEDRQANYARVRELLSASPPQRGAMVVLPEMFATGFSMNVAAAAEGEERPTEKFVQQLAHEHGVFLIAGIATRGDGGADCGRNESVVFNPAGESFARYTKLHPFTLGGESKCYPRGDQIVTFRWHEFTVATFVCYDLRFPEIFRLATRRGATLMTVIANWPNARIHHWVTLLQARAIENQCYIVGGNRVGRDPMLRYPGRSLIVAPDGTILADAGDEPRVITADIDVKTVTDYRRKLPFLADMRAGFLGMQDSGEL